MGWGQRLSGRRRRIAATHGDRIVTIAALAAVNGESREQAQRRIELYLEPLSEAVRDDAKEYLRDTLGDYFQGAEVNR